MLIQQVGSRCLYLDDSALHLLVFHDFFKVPPGLWYRHDRTAGNNKLALRRSSLSFLDLSLDEMDGTVLDPPCGRPCHLHVGSSVVRQEGFVLLAKGPLKQTLDPCSHDQ